MYYWFKYLSKTRWYSINYSSNVWKITVIVFSYESIQQVTRLELESALPCLLTSRSYKGDRNCCNINQFNNCISTEGQICKNIKTKVCKKFLHTHRFLGSSMNWRKFIRKMEVLGFVFVFPCNQLAILLL